MRYALIFLILFGSFGSFGCLVKTEERDIIDIIMVDYTKIHSANRICQGRLNVCRGMIEQRENCTELIERGNCPCNTTFKTFFRERVVNITGAENVSVEITNMTLEFCDCDDDFDLTEIKVEPECCMPLTLEIEEW